MGADDLYSLFGTGKRRVPVTRAAGLIVWNDPERFSANNDLGMCNTSQDPSLICVLGGLGCNVDHVQIARENLASYRQQLQQTPTKPGAADSR